MVGGDEDGFVVRDVLAGLAKKIKNSEHVTLKGVGQ